MSKTDTRKELLDLARDLLQSRGASGFSFQDLADRLRLRKASIHYHFKTKADLFSSLIETYQLDFTGWQAKVATLPPEEKLRRYTRIFRHYIDDGQKLCPGGALAFESASQPAPLRKKLREFQIDHREWLEDVLKEGQKKSVFEPSLDVRSTAIMIGSSVQGALQISRLHESPALFDRAMESVLDLLQRRSKPSTRD